MVQIVHVRVLNPEQRAAVWNSLGSYLKKRGITDAPESILQQPGAGAMFGVLVDDRVVGSVFVRVWPNSALEGDIHIIASRRRITDWDSVMTFLSFIKARAALMNIKQWRVAVEVDNDVVLDSLRHIGFRDTGVHPFPGLGMARMLTREVT